MEWMVERADPPRNAAGADDFAFGRLDSAGAQGVEESLLVEINNGAALPESAKNKYREEAWAKFCKEKRKALRLADNEEVFVAHSVQAEGTVALTEGVPAAKLCTFITWAVAKIAPAARRNAAGAQPFTNEDKHSLFTQACQKLNRSLNDATKFGCLVRFWAAEGQFFCDESYHTIHDIIPLTPRSAVNEGEPQEKATEEFSKVKVRQFRVYHASITVADSYQFSIRAARTGAPGANDFVVGPLMWS